MSLGRRLVLCVIGGLVVGAYVAQKLAVEAWHWPRGGVDAMFLGVSALVASIAYAIARRE